MLCSVASASSDIKELIKIGSGLFEDKKRRRKEAVAFFERIRLLTNNIHVINSNMNKHCYQQLKLDEFGELNITYCGMVAKLVSLNSLIVVNKNNFKGKKETQEAFINQLYAKMVESEMVYNNLKTTFQCKVIQASKKPLNLTVLPERRIRSAQFGDNVDESPRTRSINDGEKRKKRSLERISTPRPKAFVDSSDNLANLANEISNIEGVKLKLALKHINTKRALETEGLFRISPRQGEFQSVKSNLEKGVGIPDETSVHVVAQLVKDSLKEIVFNRVFVKGMFRLASDDSLTTDEKMDRVEDLFTYLPAVQQQLLNDLFKVFLKVSKKSDTNKMTADNLSIVIAPNLFPAPSTNDMAVCLSEEKKCRDAFKLFFEAYEGNPEKFSGTDVKFI